MLAAVALAVVVTGCSDDAATPLSAPDGPAPTSSAAAATTTPPPGSGLPATEVTLTAAGDPSPADKQVIEGYRKFWLALGTAYTTGDVTALRAATVDPATTEFVTV